MPGIGGEPFPEPAGEAERLERWRAAGAERGLAEVDARGWDRFVLVVDSNGTPTAVRIARARPASVLGLAIGHAALSRATDGERAPVRGEVWQALIQLANTGQEAFVRYGIAQMTRGGINEEQARQMIERFPEMSVVTTLLKALARAPEPVGDDLAALGLPLLLAKHEGCLANSDEGFEDVVAAFPSARTVICAEACTSSPSFDEALRAFAGGSG